MSSLTSFADKPTKNEIIANASAATFDFIESLDFFSKDSNEKSESNALEKAGELLDFFDKNTEEEVNSRLKFIENEDVKWIFETSVKSIKTVYQYDELNSDENIIRTLKQVSCIFVAESEYGNLSEIYDHCDQTNIAQIRPPAYKEVYKQCPDYFTSEKLSFLGDGTNCDTLHPYEMPLCCEATKDGEDKKYCKKYNDNPLKCVSLNKRNFLEKADSMPKTTSQITDEDNIKADPIRCQSTSGDTYIRVPALPMHSIFAGIFYLKLRGYEPMSDKKFESFGAKWYNGANKKEQQGYQIKLNTCLSILNKPDNSEVISRTYNRIMNNP